MIRKPFFVRPLALYAIASGNEADGYPASNLALHKSIGTTWKSEGNTNLWARGQFDSARPVDFCAVIAANALPGTKLRLRLGTSQAQVDGTAPFDSGALDFISPAIVREDGLYHSHLELASAVTASWWRIDITGHTGDFEAAMLVLGQRIETSRFYNNDFEYGFEDLGEGKFTRFGVFDETPGVVLRTLDMTLAWVSEAEFFERFDPMLHAIGTRQPIYLCFDPAATTMRQRKTYMGMLKKPGFARGRPKPGVFTQDYSLLSMI